MAVRVLARQRAIKTVKRALQAQGRRKVSQVPMREIGRSSGFCIDPIEKKPLNHFLPGTPVLVVRLRLASCRVKAVD
jgi:pyruvate formate lyase activating enzyme